MLRNMKMGIRLGFLVGTIILFTIAIAVIGYERLSNISSLTKKMYVTGLEGSKLLEEANNAVWELRFGIANYTLANAETRKKILDGRPKLYEVMEDRLKKYDNLDITAEQRRTLKELLDFYSQYKSGAPGWFALIDANKLDEAVEYRAKVTNFAASEMVKRLSQLVEQQVKNNEVLWRNAERTAANAKKQIVIISIVLVVLASILGSWLIQSVIRVLGAEPGDLADIARNIAAGNIAVKFKSNETIHGIYADMKQMADNLDNTLKKIHDVTDGLSSATENIFFASANVLRVADDQKSSIEETAGVIMEMDLSTSTIATGAASLSASAVSTSSAIMELKQSVEKVAENSSFFESITHETTSAIEETVANIRQISESLEKLSSSSEAIASSITEVNATVQEIEHRATESVVLSEKVTSDASEKGIATALTAMEGMKLIRSRVGSLSDVINILGSRSQDIEKILTIIADVADATTLLSLNAAILAAQAGESGKAFAVVADEMKSLADRTAISTKEIAALVSSVQQETQSSVTMAAEGIEAIVQGLKLVSDVNEALKGIVRSSKESTEMSKAIHRSTSEESQVIRQITDTIREMSKQVEQISLALQEQTKGSNFVIEQTEKMKDISSKLKIVIGEQRDGSVHIATAIEDVAQQSEQIAEATDRQKQKSSELVQLMDKIQNATDTLRHASNALNEIISTLKKDARNLHDELQKFKV